jgi:hypothetical protein
MTVQTFGASFGSYSNQSAEKGDMNAVRVDLWESQRLDRVTGLVQPWFTHSALDEIQEWDLHDKVVLEWGGGHSSLWWGTRCRSVFTIETNPDWCAWISAKADELGITNVTVLHRASESPVDFYLQIPEGCTPDIVVIDGAMLRFECLSKAIALPRPVTIIFDNWQQDGAFISPEAEGLMRPFLGASYAQAERTHLKHPWQTAIWRLA